MLLKKLIVKNICNFSSKEDGKLELEPESEPAKKIPGAGQKRTDSATLTATGTVPVHLTELCLTGVSFKCVPLMTFSCREARRALAAVSVSTTRHGR